MGDVITVQLKWREQQCAIDIDTSITVGDLREVVAIETNIEPKCQRLVYSGRVLKDEEILSAVGIRNNHSIYVVYASPASPAPSTPAASPPRPAPTSAPSPFGSPFGWPGSTAGGMPQAGSAGSFDNLQQQLLNDPNLMRQVTESPIMQYMMDNPELMRSMMMANPQMQAVIEQNPEVGHALNDPATLRQMMQLVRNPDLMLEMQRNADRAMQHIEVMPGGFNALRRMYEGVSSPMEEAARSQLGGTEHANTAFTALRDNSAPPPADRPNDVALPNPWGPLPPATPQAPAASRQPFCGGGGNPFFGAGGSPGMSQMLSDPNMNAMIQSMMSDPAAMEGMRRLAPGMGAGNQQHMQSLMQDPAFMRMAMAGAGGQGMMPSFRPPVPSDDAIRASLPEYEARFAAEISNIREMGLEDDAVRIIAALLATDGDLSLAVDHLLQSRR